MKISSVNVGRPRAVLWRGETVRTGIWKAPVAGRVAVRNDHIEGDAQADLRVHGGRDKAVYAYAAGHYARWRAELPDADLSSYGAFGENLTLDDFTESDVFIGDEYRAGSARLVVTQPRMPCSKLAVRFGRADMPDLFLASGRNGFYLAILEEGVVEAGDDVTLLQREPSSITVAEAAHLYAGKHLDPALLRRGLASPVPDGWKERYRQRLDRLARSGGPAG
jgi:MOSC domain-containing protein YiiM